MLRFLYSLYFHFVKSLVVIFFSTLILVFIPLSRIFGKKATKKIGSFIGKSWGQTLIFLSGIQFSVSYSPQIDFNKNYVFAGNHQSSFDIYIYYAFILGHFNWIAKKSLFYMPFLGLAMAFQGHIFVERENSHKAMLSFKKAIKKVKNGASIAIFPEGSRSANGKLQEFKRGAFVLARMSGMDLVPITIKNAHKVAPKGKFMLRPKEKIQITFHAPLNGKSKTLSQELRQTLQEQLEKKQ